MTYCVAAAIDSGLVFVSDSRTNAGPDQLGTYSKMHRFFGDGERSFVLLSSGNLATTQGVLTNLERDIRSGSQPNLSTVADLEEGAECVGAASVVEQEHYGQGANGQFKAEASFIFGGQIRDQPPGIFLVYPQGNFVRASDTAPYLQIGEVKYGKPILDRIIAQGTPMDEALKCLLVSMDSTMRSNATVGPPIEILLYSTDSLTRGDHRVLEENDPYLITLRERWNERIKEAFTGMPALENLPSSTATITRIDR